MGDLMTGRGLEKHNSKWKRKKGAPGCHVWHRRSEMTGQAGRTEKKKKFGGGRGEGDITNPKFAFVFPLSKFLITAASGLHPSFLLACSLARSLAAAVAAAAPVAARRPNQCGVFVRLSCSTATSALYFLVVQPHRVELSS